MKFEVLVSDQHVVLKSGLCTVWWNRIIQTTPTANNVNLNVAFNPQVAPAPEFKILKEDDSSRFADFTCHGLAYGLIGLFLHDKLVLVKQCHSVGRFPFGAKDEVFKIHKISVVPLACAHPIGDLGLDKCSQDTCSKPVPVQMGSLGHPFISASFKDSMIDESSLIIHSFGNGNGSSGGSGGGASGGFGQSTPTSLGTSSSNGMQKTWNQIKLTASNSVKPRSGGEKLPPKSSSAGSGSGDQSAASNGRADEKDKLERRFIDELYKMFNETNSFYFSWTGDLTHSVQAQQKLKLHFGAKDIRTVPLWKRVDDRFFWNKYMLRPVMEMLEAMTPTNECEAAEGEEAGKDAANLFDSLSTNSRSSSIDDALSHSHIWVLPIIQGFVRIEKCFFDLHQSSPVGGSKDLAASDTAPGLTAGPGPGPGPGPVLGGSGSSPLLSSLLEDRDYYLMTLISRRSRFRAGTRYKKRGVDENGRCANYVETEQIFTYGSHTVSFVCVRGSVPLFWSQVGHKYRPPPRLDRTAPENEQAFRRHFEHEFAIYEGDVVAVNLIERAGRESILGDAFLDAAIKLDDARLAYVSFDFHDYCRGMRFENVSILIDRIYDFIKDIRYCWLDDDGMICEQRGVLRINCIDCLDRTNIVMTAIAKAVMDIQLVRLGLLPPEGQLPSNSRRIFQLAWAHNGDIISRQYAGTAALKGDYTRTGERKISGVVRDGYNSANRYYLNRFRDAFRQAVIDIMQGNPVSESLSSPEQDKPSAENRQSAGSVPADSQGLKQSSSSNSIASGGNGSASLSLNDQEYHERIKLVIEDCKKILVPQEEVILGGWPLVDADPVTGTALSACRVAGELPESEMDIVLVLTKDCYYVADYDDQTDRIVKYQKVLLEDLEKIELGAEPSYHSGAFGSMRSNRSLISYAARFHYCIGEQSGYFHMFRSTGTRFFNNMAIPIRTREEALESLKAICESFKVALSVKSLNVPFHEVSRLERRNSKRLYSSSSFKLSSESSGTGTAAQQSGPAGPSGPAGFEATPSGAGGRKLFTGMYSHLSRLRGKLIGNSGARSALQLDGLSPGGIMGLLPEQETQRRFGEDGGSKRGSQGDEDDDDDNSNNNSNDNSNDNSNQNSDSDNDDDDDEDEEDSMLKMRKARFAGTGIRPAGSPAVAGPNSSSSSLVVERTFSSDLSESDFEDSELALPPISELGSPELADEHELRCSSRKQLDMDRVLESCGILLTSPPLHRNRAAVGRHTESGLSPDTPTNNTNASQTTTIGKTKSVLHDVDDFVLDSMKKASLRQLRRKAAISKSQASLCSSTGSIGSRKATCANTAAGGEQAAKNSNKSSRTAARTSSSRCIFSSELALDSIVSQSIKKDIIIGGKLSSSFSSDALDTGGGGVGSCALNLGPGLGPAPQQQQQGPLSCNRNLHAYTMMSSSSFAALHTHDHANNTFGDPVSFNFINCSNCQMEQPEQSAAERASNDSQQRAMNEPYTAGTAGFKESSLSVSDLAADIHAGGLKTSRSSNTLQCPLSSGFISLNLPSLTATSTLSIASSGDGAGATITPMPSAACGANSISSGGGATGALNFTSSLLVKKDLVLSPLTRIAKGMLPSLGLTLRGSSSITTDSPPCDGELEKRILQTRSRIVQM